MIMLNNYLKKLPVTEEKCAVSPNVNNEDISNNILGTNTS